MHEEIIGFQPVKTFLSSVERNSISSRCNYASGLIHFQGFLSQKYPDYNLETILKSLLEDKISRYEVIDGFISYLHQFNLTSSSIITYVASIRSYLAFNDVDVIPSRFKRKVKMPKIYREDAEPLDASDIRKILLACKNRRITAYLLILASGGPRAVEALAIRLCDLDFSVSPTKIHIRKEYAKTRVARDIYISNEATHYLKQWLDWKYGDQKKGGTKIHSPNDLVFRHHYAKRSPSPRTMYNKILDQFHKMLTIVEMDERKEGGKQKRRKITLHSFRRFTKSVISDQVNQDYSEWFLGHSKNPYYTKKELERREIYATKCMKYLTFLDYTTLETRGKNIEAKLLEKDNEMQTMKTRHEQDMKAMREEMNQQFNQIMSMIQQNPTLAQLKPGALTKKMIQ